MKLADEMLLAQMRESALKDVPADQWELVVGEVEKAGGVRQVQGYTRTLIYDAITKASFGGNRSEAGRYAANVRWQDGSKADRKERDYGSSKRSYNKWANSDPSEQTATVGNLQSWIKQGFLDPDNLSDQDSARLSQDANAEELKEGNIADELVNPNMPPDYNDYGDEPAGSPNYTVEGVKPVSAMPPDYNDYGDEPGSGARLMRWATPMDLKNPQASASKKTPESPSKRIASEVKNASQKNDAAKVVDSARQDAEDAETDLFRAEKDGKSVAEAEKNFAETKALFESAKQAFKERFGSEKMPYQGM
jgi:hypothetical protein